ncbi:hypothetical protein ABIA33_004203 [Streptacidiphilus sp. MAP12-16]|uniref:hypothetical protein n=1 Tax=Streptacidiphilus sp. MAP12-16 TaxID=3156300 RepID=UPI003511F6E7
MRIGGSWRRLPGGAGGVDAYARRGEIAEATPDAVDISERPLARRIVEEEQLRLAPVHDLS